VSAGDVTKAQNIHQTEQKGFTSAPPSTLSLHSKLILGSVIKHRLKPGVDLERPL
jgi:hypothetical protein